MRRNAAFLGALAVLAGYDLLLRPWMREWGSTSEERKRPLPGDEVPADVLAHYTKALTIDAPAETVWPWLVQIGDRRAGFYSYDWVERLLFPGTVHRVEGERSATQIHPELQDLHLGDAINDHRGAIPVEEVTETELRILSSRTGLEFLEIRRYLTVDPQLFVAR